MLWVKLELLDSNGIESKPCHVPWLHIYVMVTAELYDKPFSIQTEVIQLRAIAGYSLITWLHCHDLLIQMFIGN